LARPSLTHTGGALFSALSVSIAGHKASGHPIIRLRASQNYDFLPITIDRSVASSSI
jgi:hypothetical protein